LETQTSNRSGALRTVIIIVWYFIFLAALIFIVGESISLLVNYIYTGEEASQIDSALSYTLGEKFSVLILVIPGIIVYALRKKQ